MKGGASVLSRSLSIRYRALVRGSEAYLSNGTVVNAIIEVKLNAIADSGGKYFCAMYCKISVGSENNPVLGLEECTGGSVGDWTCALSFERGANNMAALMR